MDAINLYKGKLRITAQATYDRWPEANGMRRELFQLGEQAGLSVEQIKHDLDTVPIDCDGGRW